MPTCSPRRGYTRYHANVLSNNRRECAHLCSWIVSQAVFHRQCSRFAHTKPSRRGRDSDGGGGGNLTSLRQAVKPVAELLGKTAAACWRRYRVIANHQAKYFRENRVIRVWICRRRRCASLLDVLVECSVIPCCVANYSKMLSGFLGLACLRTITREVRLTSGSARAELPEMGCGNRLSWTLFFASRGAAVSSRCRARCRCCLRCCCRCFCRGLRGRFRLLVVVYKEG